MYKNRFGLVATLSVLLLILSSPSFAQLSKLDEWNGYKSFKLGMDKSALKNQMKPEPDSKGRYELTPSELGAVGVAFGDSVMAVYLKFDANNKLNEIRLTYPYADDDMDSNTRNRFLGKIPQALTSQLGQFTGRAGLFPTGQFSWAAKNVRLDYSFTRIAGTWVRELSITPRN